MFTGLVEHMGLVASIQELDTSESGGNGWTLTISNSAEILTDCHLGDSIAINGKKTERQREREREWRLTIIIRQGLV
jgi:riboflavin synthase alpha subunit